MDHVFVSGGTKGIGKSIVKLFLANGFLVSTCSRSSDFMDKLLLELNSECKTRIKIYPFDLRETDHIESLVDDVIAGFGHPSIIINNAGIYQEKSFLEERLDYIKEIFALNFFSPYRLTQLFGENMIAQGRGKIINICSIASYEGIPGAHAYVSSKHALLGMSRTIRKEWASKGVHVSAILPGHTFTSSWEGTDVDPKSLIQPDDVAKLVLQIATLSDSSNIDELRLSPLNF
jgi:short-subunit dehydrogenase